MTAPLTNDLHKLFRSVITLLTLVTAISNGGQSRFSVDRKPEAYPGALEENVQPRERFVHALTTLLARSNEVIATAANSSGKVLAFRLASFEQDYHTDDESDYQETESSDSAALPAKAVADDDESDYQETESSDSSAALQVLAKALAPSFVAITNPQDDDYYSFGDDLCLLVQKGNSHIGERFGDWDQLLAIP